MHTRTWGFLAEHCVVTRWSLTLGEFNQCAAHWLFWVSMVSCFTYMKTTVKSIFLLNAIVYVPLSLSLIVLATAGDGWHWIFLISITKRLRSCCLNPVVPVAPIELVSLAPHEKSSIRNSDVKIDPSLKLDAHINAVVKSCFFFSWGSFKKSSPSCLDAT